MPFWAWGWTNNVPKLARGASRRYGPIVSRYYRKTLPMFTYDRCFFFPGSPLTFFCALFASPTYRMARSVIAEKLQAELEYLQQRKHTQQRPVSPPLLLFSVILSYGFVVCRRLISQHLRARPLPHRLRSVLPFSPSNSQERLRHWNAQPFATFESSCEVFFFCCKTRIVFTNKKAAKSKIFFLLRKCPHSFPKPSSHTVLPIIKSICALHSSLE